MQQLIKNTFSRGMLKLHEISDGKTLTLLWEGKSVEKNPGEFLNPILVRIAQDPGAPRVVINMEGLAQMNSSTMPPLIIFMKNLSEKGIEADFIYSAVSEWQRVSFQMLANLSKTMTGIRVLSGAREPG